MVEQKLVVVEGDGTEEINELLSSGWKVAMLSPISNHVAVGGDTSYSDTGDVFAYVVLEKQTEKVSDNGSSSYTSSNDWDSYKKEV